MKNQKKAKSASSINYYTPEDSYQENCYYSSLKKIKKAETTPDKSEKNLNPVRRQLYQHQNQG
jgi:hypothetical protein